MIHGSIYSDLAIIMTSAMIHGSNDSDLASIVTWNVIYKLDARMSYVWVWPEAVPDAWKGERLTRGDSRISL